MNIFKKFIDKKHEATITENAENGCVYRPMDGKIIPLKEINDGVFSEGMMGKGCGLKPHEGKVYAPFDGEILLIAHTKHAIALKSHDGIEILIHVGMDTVKMNGMGFNPVINVGDKVRCGQLIMTFSIPDIEAAGYSTISAIIVTNSEQYNNIEVLNQGSEKKLEKMLKIS